MQAESGSRPAPGPPPIAQLNFQLEMSFPTGEIQRNLLYYSRYGSSLGEMSAHPADIPFNVRYVCTFSKFGGELAHFFISEQCP
jgi:hypothetical protein